MSNDGLCGRCGAPLPRDERATCAYCGVTAGEAPKVSPSELAERRLRVIETFRGSMSNGAAPEQAIAAAAREHLGPLGETSALARVVVALARDFERESQSSILGDAMAMGRLLEAYLQAIESMRDQGFAELNLPFLSATAAGPHHLSRRLDPGVVQGLIAPTEEISRKKAWWWPF